MMKEEFNTEGELLYAWLRVIIALLVVIKTAIQWHIVTKHTEHLNIIKTFQFPFGFVEFLLYYTDINKMMS